MPDDYDGRTFLPEHHCSFKSDARSSASNEEDFVRQFRDLLWSEVPAVAWFPWGGAVYSIQRTIVGAVWSVPIGRNPHGYLVVSRAARLGADVGSWRPTVTLWRAETFSCWGYNCRRGATPGLRAPAADEK